MLFTIFLVVLLYERCCCQLHYRLSNPPRQADPISVPTTFVTVRQFACRAFLRNHAVEADKINAKAVLLLKTSGHLGTNTAGLIPKKPPSFPAMAALIFRFPAKIADRLLWGTTADRSPCLRPRDSIKKRRASLQGLWGQVSILLD